MKNGYDWSGGPWFFKWDKGVSVTLTPNPKWYGPKPTIKKVIFKILADTAAEFQAFKSGEVSAIYPQPEPSAIASIKGGLEGTKTLYTADTGNVEALWMNNAKFPFNSVAVRQAVAYSIDRDAIVKRLYSTYSTRLARRRRRLRAGQTVEVLVTAHAYDGKLVRWRLRSGQVPRAVTRCVPLGNTKPRRRCSRKPRWPPSGSVRPGRPSATSARRIPTGSRSEAATSATT